MRLRTFLIVDAVIASVFGLVLLLIPTLLGALYGISLNPGGTMVGQLFGTALLGFGVINWLMRNSTEGHAVRAVLLGNFISDVLGFMVGVLYQLIGREGLNQPGWPTVVMYFALMCGFGYFLFSPWSPRTHQRREP
jgi:hypothetical protein